MIGLGLTLPAVAVRRHTVISPSDLAGDLAQWDNDGGERILTGASVLGHSVWRARSMTGFIYRGPFQRVIPEITAGTTYEVSVLAKRDQTGNLAFYFAGSNFNVFATLTDEWAWHSKTITAGAGGTVEIRAADFIQIAAIRIHEA